MTVSSKCGFFWRDFGRREKTHWDSAGFLADREIGVEEAGREDGAAAGRAAAKKGNARSETRQRRAFMGRVESGRAGAASER
jgi:hypothetical protein